MPNNPEWEFLHPAMTLKHLGYIPLWLNTKNPLGAVEQIDKAYRFGGWQAFEGFEMKPDGSLKYPGDPTLKPLARTKLRDQEVFFYQYSWVAVRDPDGTFSVARID